MTKIFKDIISQFHLQLYTYFFNKSLILQTMINFLLISITYYKQLLKLQIKLMGFKTYIGNIF